MLIGITGTIGAGKGMVALHLEGKGFRHLSVSGFLAEKAIVRRMPPTRVTRRMIGNEYRAQGPTALVEAVLAEANPAEEDIVIESLHTVPEVEYVKKLGGVVISVDAPLVLRWERIKVERSVKDSGSYEEFVAEENRQMASANPNENNLVAAILAADFHTQNLGTPQELFRQVDAILAKM
jgi:dephospho-CoA kinase